MTKVISDSHLQTKQCVWCLCDYFTGWICLILVQPFNTSASNKLPGFIWLFWRLKCRRILPVSRTASDRPGMMSVSEILSQLKRFMRSLINHVSLDWRIDKGLLKEDVVDESKVLCLFNHWDAVILSCNMSPSSVYSLPEALIQAFSLSRCLPACYASSKQVSFRRLLPWAGEAESGSDCRGLASAQTLRPVSWKDVVSFPPSRRWQK